MTQSQVQHYGESWAMEAAQAFIPSIHATDILCRLVHGQGPGALLRHHLMSARAYQAQCKITKQVLLV